MAGENSCIFYIAIYTAEKQYIIYNKIFQYRAGLQD